MARWFRYRRRRRVYYRRRRTYRSKRLQKSLFHAKNMSKTNVVKLEATTTLNGSIGAGSASIQSPISMAALLSNSAMFTSLSNVYDQVKVISCRFQVQAVAAPNGSSGMVFGVYDKTGFDSTANLTQLQTYGSYKCGVARIAGTECSSLIYYLPRNAIESIQWFDTKDLSKMINTLSFGYQGVLAAEGTIALSVTASIMCAFRGSRLDTRAVSGS